VRAPDRSGAIGITLDDDEPACWSAARITGEAASTKIVQFFYGRLLPSDDLVRTDPRTESQGIRW